MPTVSAMTSPQPNQGRSETIEPYQNLSGSLRFIFDTTHLPIAYDADVLARSLQDPAERHMQAGKLALLYLQGNRDAGTLYTHKVPLNLVLFTKSTTPATLTQAIPSQCRALGRRTTAALAIIVPENSRSFVD